MNPSGSRVLRETFYFLKLTGGISNNLITSDKMNPSV